MDEITKKRMNVTVDRYFKLNGNVSMDDLEFIVSLLASHHEQLSAGEVAALRYLIGSDCGVNEQTYRELASGTEVRLVGSPD